ncbi:hypothetical protein SAMD00019534_011220 [Acytostelium subglobosum LB1]|uniref:hypothetical protein n=1 Tax=Acytostelium subglobosum LB1 TaxID=1410327 RepID=UPI000644EC96|nr:hypothetical protein SAMD00019534_011220 [Acytostelium subglobosum LB1]GAM17947.1 hypothetical protein SAMD00019534_011220 [Acytostelium subglobosum LB1]|eukprot:XP_012758543.1 hypothetical protein SAMD00019534_011220 [Acytostelium subglobosum LB1]
MRRSQQQQQQQQQQQYKQQKSLLNVQDVDDDFDDDDDDNINNSNSNRRIDDKYRDQRVEKDKNLPRSRKYWNALKRWSYFFKHLLLHTFNNNRRNKLSYLLGFSACFLVVFVVSLCVSIISNTPIVFLNLSEVSSGEMDIKVMPGQWSMSTNLNYTLISQLLNEPSQSYHAPRQEATAFILSAASCPNGNVNEQNWKYHGNNCEPSCFDTVCRGATTDKASLFAIDTSQEKRMGLGREWKLPAPSPGSIYLQEDLANALNIKQNDYVYVAVSALDLLEAIWANANTSSEYPYIYLTCKVEAIFSSPGGKFGSSINNAIIMDYATLIPYTVTQIDPEISPFSRQLINNSNLYEYAEYVIINLPPSRLEPYINSNQDTILKNLVQFSSKVLYKIGFNDLDAELPVMSELSNNRYVSLFLGLILNVIIFILLFLSILLIYSLLMIDVETRTFEMGVMRMIGTTRSGIIQLMLCKAFSYSLPSWVLGLVLAQVFGFVVSAWFSSLTGVPIPPKLTPTAILLATGLGILIPVAAAIFPIKSALGRNLHDSLDVKHSKSSAVQISIERSEDSSFSSSVAIVGFILAAFGFGIYYIFPLSLLSFNLALLLNMFFLLLIAMLLGLILLALNVEHLLERLIVFALLFWEKRAIPQIVLKNLVAHKLRNRKTAIMYAISLAFIIFVNVSYSTQQASMNYKIQQSYGSYLRVDMGRVRISTSMMMDIDQELTSNPLIHSFGYISMPMSSISPTWQATQISNIGRIYSDNNNLYSASPAIFATAIQGFLKVSSLASDPDYRMDTGIYNGVSEQIYSEQSSNKIIIGSLYQSNIGASLSSKILLKINIQDWNNHLNSTGYLVEPMAFLDTAPAFRFSKFPSVTGQDAIISIPSYIEYAGDLYDSVRELPIKSIILNYDTAHTNLLKEQLKNMFDGMGISVDIRDYADKVAPFETASTIIQYFFSFTTVIAMMISFFSLMSSMFTNILEQSKEIGVLRAIGIPRPWMVRIYIYESFVLVFSSSLLGVCIGSIVGWTMILQRVLFTQLPIPFVFPWVLLIVIFICSILFSFISAFGPIRKVLNQQVVSIMRIVT